MEIKITTRQILLGLQILSWILFIGLCVEAGSFIFNACFSLYQPAAAQYFGLTKLYEYDQGYFLVTLLLMSIAGVLKAFIFYRIIQILLNKNLTIAQPFHPTVLRFIQMVAYLALGIGVFSYWGVHYVEWLVKQGVKMPDIHYLRLGGADVWFFMGVVLIVIAQVFKRGIELQSDNELTI